MSLVQKQSRAVFFDLGMEMQELTMSSTGLSLKTEARQAARQSPGQAVGKGARRKIILSRAAGLKYDKIFPCKTA